MYCVEELELEKSIKNYKVCTIIYIKNNIQMKTYKINNKNKVQTN